MTRKHEQPREPSDAALTPPDPAELSIEELETTSGGGAIAGEAVNEVCHGVPGTNTKSCTLSA